MVVVEMLAAVLVSQAVEMLAVVPAVEMEMEIPLDFTPFNK
jgi:hypothetical protein